MKIKKSKHFYISPMIFEILQKKEKTKAWLNWANPLWKASRHQRH
jgi:hypothetical protein